MKDDPDLVVKALRGGPESFAPIVERYKDAVFGVAFARLRHFQDAEDIAQTTFLKAFEGLGRLEDPRRLGAWLRSIAIHTCIHHIERRVQEVDIEQVEEPIAEGPTPLETVEQRERRDAVVAWRCGRIRYADVSNGTAGRFASGRWSSFSA